MKKSSLFLRVFSCIIGYVLVVYLMVFGQGFLTIVLLNIVGTSSVEGYIRLFYNVSSIMNNILLFGVGFFIYHINWKPRYSYFRWSFRNRKVVLLISYVIVALIIIKLTEVICDKIEYGYLTGFSSSIDISLESVFSIHTLLSLLGNIISGFAYAVIFVFFVPASLGSWNNDSGKKARFEWQSIISAFYFSAFVMLKYTGGNFQDIPLTLWLPTVVTDFALVILGCLLKGDRDDYLHSLVECGIMFSLVYTFMYWI